MALLALAAASLSGCATLLGIEEAECHQSFDGCGSQGMARNDASVASTGTTETSVSRQDASAGDSGVDAGPLARHAAVCAQYCTLVQQACTDENTQYASEPSCLEICNEVMRTQAEQDAAGVSTNDTIECRLDAARAVLEVGVEIASLCLSAGMWGNDECGPPCEVYCGMMQTACSAQFEAFDSCPEECLEVEPSKAPFGVEVPPGNTLECRINHIRLATSTRSPEVHCPHAAGIGDPCAATQAD